MYIHKYLTNLSKKIDGSTSSVDLWEMNKLIILNFQSLNHFTLFKRFQKIWFKINFLESL